MRVAVSSVLLALAGMGLVACTDTKPLVSQAEGARIGKQCQIERGAVGSYSLFPATASTNAESRLPRARAIPSMGGTKEGEEEINACIRQKILGGGRTTSAPSAAPSEDIGRIIAAPGCRKGGGPLQGGSDLCVGF